MGRADGRVRPGQNIASAFSARAWNRAQDAADVVLGERGVFGTSPAFALPSSLVIKCSVTAGNVPGTSTPLEMRLGMIVNLRGDVATGEIAVQGDRRGGWLNQSPTGVDALAGVPFQAVPFVDRRLQASRPFGVIVGGVVMPRGSTPTVVDVCIAGVCVAELRRRSALSLLTSVQPATIRFSQETLAELVGVAEDSECGSGRLLRWLGPVQNSVNRYAVVLL